MNMDPKEPFDLEVGKIYRRIDIHDRFGGQRQGGISTPANMPYIFLFSGEQGEEYGYDDGQADDQSYLYTGEGQVGDMAMLRGNRAIRDATENEKSIHLFEYERSGHVRYAGEMLYAGHHREEKPDRTGHLRSAIVFELAYKSNDQ